MRESEGIFRSFEILLLRLLLAPLSFPSPLLYRAGGRREEERATERNFVYSIRTAASAFPLPTLSSLPPPPPHFPRRQRRKNGKGVFTFGKAQCLPYLIRVPPRTYRVVGSEEKPKMEKRRRRRIEKARKGGRKKGRD